MKIEIIEDGIIEIKHNKRRGLKLRKDWTKMESLVKVVFYMRLEDIVNVNHLE